MEQQMDDGIDNYGDFLQQTGEVFEDEAVATEQYPS
jgi:hypothetical protein